MPVKMITSSENVDIGLLAETVSGTLEQDVYELFQTTGGQLDYPSSEATDNSTGDHGGPLSVRTISRGGDATFPAHLRFNGNKLLTQAAMRDEYAVAVTITGSSDLNFLTGGTHLDGSTGLQITGPDGDFDSLIEYGGATANGAEGLVMLMSGWATAANNQPVGIKAVHNTGSVAKIDLWPGYGGGGSGVPFGATKSGETLKSAVLRVGEAVRNHQSDGDLVRVSYSLMVDFFEHEDAGRFIGLRGWVGNDYTLAINGKGEVIVTVTGNGRGWTPLSMTPVNGESLGSHFVDNTPDNLMYIGGEDLQFLSIVPYANAVTATNVPILLADANVSQFNMTCAGNVAVVDNIVGNDELIPRRGRHVPTGSLNWYMTDEEVVEQITQIGARATRQLGAVHAAFKDEQNQWIIHTLPKCNFQATGPNGGAVGSAVEGVLNFGAMRLSKNAKALIIQQIDAG